MDNAAAIMPTDKIPILERINVLRYAKREGRCKSILGRFFRFRLKLGVCSEIILLRQDGLAKLAVPAKWYQVSHCNLAGGETVGDAIISVFRGG